MVIALLWSYAYFVEVQTTWYAHEPIEWEVFSFMSGRYTPFLFVMLFGNSLPPITALCFRKVRRSIWRCWCFPSDQLLMYIERFLIIIPSRLTKTCRLSGRYSPSWVETLHLRSPFARILPSVHAFRQVFPMVAVTDVRELEAREAKSSSAAPATLGHGEGVKSWSPRIFRDVESAGVAVGLWSRRGSSSRRSPRYRRSPTRMACWLRPGGWGASGWRPWPGPCAGPWRASGWRLGTARPPGADRGQADCRPLAGIVTFEVTMLCAIIGTMVGMFWEMKLPFGSRRLYDPEIAEGAIGISVTFHPEGEVVYCGGDQGPCIGAIAALSVTEQKARAEGIMNGRRLALGHGVTQ